jgi:hypothetical protein
MNNEFNYIGINQSGLAVALVVDDPKYKKDTAKIVSQWIKEGLSVMHMEHNESIERLKADWPKVKEQRAKIARKAGDAIERRERNSCVTENGLPLPASRSRTEGRPRLRQTGRPLLPQKRERPL